MSSLLGLAGLFLANAYFAAAWVAFVNVPPSRFQERVDLGEAGARLALLLAEDSSRLLAMLHFAQALTRFLFAGAAALALVPPLTPLLDVWLTPAGRSLVLACLLLGLVALVVLGELASQAWVLREPEIWAIRLAPLTAIFAWLLTPVVRLLLWLSGVLAAPLGARAPVSVTPEEIKTLVDAGEEGGAIEQDEKRMIYSIFRFSDTLVREVMIPRIDVFALEVETPLTEALDAMLARGYSRIPIYAERVDNVLGLLYAKDLLKVWRDGDPNDCHLRELLREPDFVPETKKLDDLLNEMQARRTHMAIVVDEYGGMAGIVTLEDIVEEIIGEVEDEYDAAEEAVFEQIGENEYLVHARIDMDDMNELLGTDIDSEEVDTLGGFIFGRLGRVPRVGERLEVDGLLLEIKNVIGRRIGKVRIVRLQDAGTVS